MAVRGPCRFCSLLLVVSLAIRGHFYLCLYWVEALAKQDEDEQLKACLPTLVYFLVTACGCQKAQFTAGLAKLKEGEAQISEARGPGWQIRFAICEVSGCSGPGEVPGKAGRHWWLLGATVWL